MSEELTEEEKALLIRIVDAERRRVLVQAQAIAAQPGLPEQVSAEMSHQLTMMAVGNDDTRATFAQKADQAWRKLQFRLQNAGDGHRRRKQEQSYISGRIVSHYRDLIKLHSAYSKSLEDLQPNPEMRGSHFIELIEPMIEAVETEIDEVGKYLKHWLFVDRLNKHDERVGRPRRGGPELGFAAELALAWQESFSQPAGIGSETCFMRVYSPLCEQLGLKPLSRPVLAQGFKGREKLGGKPIGAKKAGRPSKR